MPPKQGVSKRSIVILMLGCVTAVTQPFFFYHSLFLKAPPKQQQHESENKYPPSADDDHCTVAPSCRIFVMSGRNVPFGYSVGYRNLLRIKTFDTHLKIR